jgi:hypothetical protein
LGAFLGLSNLSNSDEELILSSAIEDHKANPITPKSQDLKVVDLSKSTPTSSTKKDLSRSEASVNPSTPMFAGLDENGIPELFTIADESGLVGELFRGPTESLRTETGWMITNVVSNRNVGPNVLLDQYVITDAFGTSYLANVSIGMNGVWTPLEASVISVDSERLPSGDYLITARMMVEEALDPVIQMPSGVSGTDFDVVPSQITVKLRLDPSKTEILAQAVLISGSSQSDGA